VDQVDPKTGGSRKPDKAPQPKTAFRFKTRQQIRVPPAGDRRQIRLSPKVESALGCGHQIEIADHSKYRGAPCKLEFVDSNTLPVGGRAEDQLAEIEGPARTNDRSLANGEPKARGAVFEPRLNGDSFENSFEPKRGADRLPAGHPKITDLKTVQDFRRVRVIGVSRRGFGEAPEIEHHLLEEQRFQPRGLANQRPPPPARLQPSDRRDRTSLNADVHIFCYQPSRKNPEGKVIGLDPPTGRLFDRHCHTAPGRSLDPRKVNSHRHRYQERDENGNHKRPAPNVHPMILPARFFSLIPCSSS
jgi:hypothetical protein